MSKYVGLFEAGREAIANEFEVGGRGNYRDPNPPIPDDFPTDDQFIVAAYEYADYSGDAFVLFERDGVLYEVHGGHCSCHGLEGQWEPEATTREALEMRFLGAKRDTYGIQHSPAVQHVLAAHFGWGAS